MRKILTNLKFIGLLIAVNLLSVSQVVAECTINSGPSTDDFGSHSGAVLATQIFTACETGPFKSFAFELLSHGYEAKGVSVSIEPYRGGTCVSIAPTAFNLGTFDIVPAASGVKETFTPTNNFEVTAGETYHVGMTMNVQSQPGFRGTASGRSGGFEFSQTTPTVDAIGEGSVTSFTPLRSGGATGRMIPALAFNLLLGNPTPNTPVPTMSQWGLLIFGLLVLNLGIVFIYKKELNY